MDIIDRIFEALGFYKFENGSGIHYRRNKFEELNLDVELDITTISHNRKEMTLTCVIGNKELQALNEKIK